MSNKPPEPLDQPVPEPVTVSTTGASNHESDDGQRRDRGPTAFKHLPADPSAKTCTKDQAAPKMGPEVMWASPVVVGAVHVRRSVSCCDRHVKIARLGSEGSYKIAARM